MKKILTLVAAAALTLGASFGVAGSIQAGQGHTPVVVCHWVPAHGGSYVVITVDDDGANGNKNLRAHAHHENDIIAPAGGDCAANPDIAD